MNLIKWFCGAIILSCLSSFGGNNLIDNSSFEVGVKKWHAFGDAGGNTQLGNEVPLPQRIVSTNGVARHGNNAIWFRPQLWSAPYLLTNGLKTLTFYARANSASSMLVGLRRTYQLNPDYTDQALPTNTVSVTTSWQRFTVVIGVATNGWHALEFYNNPSSSTLTWLDAVQLEEGGSASAYAPKYLEAGIDTTNDWNNLFLSDTKRAQIKIWNEGPQTNFSFVYYDVHGIWNSNIASGMVTTNALAANTNTTIYLTLPAVWGPHRLFGYITNINQSWEEVGISLLPFASQSGRNTNGMLGIHPAGAYPNLAHARSIGFTWARYISPMSWSRWDQQFLSLTTTNMNPPGTWYSDYAYWAAYTNDLVPFVTLTADAYWYHETNASLTTMIGDYTNYVGRMVTRYKDAPYGVKHWEIWNEPQQISTDGTPQPIALYTPSIYANIYTNAARLIKVIDSTAAVIAFGGYGQESDATNAWNAISPQGKTDADFLAFHLYPEASGPFDPNLTEDYRNSSTANYDLIWNALGSVRPIFNTETATRDIGGYHTDRVAYWYPFYFSEGSGFNSESWWNELECRQLPAVDRAIYNFCRTVGWGIKQYNIQYGRSPDSTMFKVNTPSIYELNGSLKPWATALVIANNFLKEPGRGRLTNAANYYVEAYLHSNSLGCVIPIWCNDRGSRTLTLDNGNTAYYDTVGNLISTNSTSILVTRSVRYLVSGDRTVAQLSNSVYGASSVTNQDTTAPAVTIDISPIGSMVAWGGNTNAFKATAIDDRVMSYDNDSALTGSTNVNQTNILYRWTFDEGGTWSPWGTTNHFYKNFASANVYRIGWQAKDKANNSSPTTYGPYFGDLSFTPTPPPIVAVGPRIKIGGRKLKIK